MKELSVGEEAALGAGLGGTFGEGPLDAAGLIEMAIIADTRKEPTIT